MSDAASKPSSAQDIFPHDRVVFFSDAVFAIAITLLAIEVRLPEAGSPQAQERFWALLIAYVISFMVMAQFWLAHMATWKRVRRVTAGLVWLDILQLMFVALMPFVTSVYSEGFLHGRHWALALYCMDLAMVSLMGWLMLRMALRQSVADGVMGAGQAHVELMGGVAPLLVFAASIPLAFFIPVWLGGPLFFLIFPLDRLLERRARQRVAVAEAD